MHPFHPGAYMNGMYGGYPQMGAHRFDVNLRKQGEDKMSNEDKVIVNNKFESEGGGRGDGVGGLGAMAAIAALGNRNDSRSNTGWGGDGFGFGGGGGLGALLAIALLGNRGGFGGRDGGDCCPTPAGLIVAQTGIQDLLQGQGAGLLATAEQTATLQNNLATLALAGQQGFASTGDRIQGSTGAIMAAISGTKDTIQNGLFLTNTNLLEGVCSIKTNDNANADRILLALQTRWTAEDQARIVAQANEIVELRQDSRRRADHDELRIQISNTNTAVAAQAQAQGQFQVQQQGEELRQLRFAVSALVGDIQAVKQGQVIFNSGTMAASGTQAAANTKVA